MKKMLSCLLLGTMVAVRAGDPPSETKFFLDSNENDVDPQKVVVVEWYITPEHLQKLPTFHPAVDEPPLALKEALADAQAELKKHLTPKMTWSLDSVELHQIDAGNSGQNAQAGFLEKPTSKWFYKVIFSTQRPDPKTSIWTEPYPVFVLMDGTVATRRERPRTKEEITESEQFAQGIKDAVSKDGKKSQ